MGAERPPPSRPLVYYPRRRGVCVTEHWIDVHGRRFAVADLSEPSRRNASWQARRLAALRAAAIETLLTLVVGIAAPSPVAWIGVALWAPLFTAIIWFAARRWPTPQELWAHHCGRPILLYVSDDHIEFGKVSRAVMRAVERNRELFP